MMTATVKELRAFERHYTASDLGLHWGMSEKTVRDWFLNEPGVIKFGSDKLRKGKLRPYVSLRIPESVALRVYARITGKAVHPTPAA